MRFHQVQMLREKRDPSGKAIAILSFDEKPHIQAIGWTSLDKPPIPGKHSTWLRDYEYVRHGTLTLLSGVDFLSGHVHAHIVERSRSGEFVEFLQLLDQYYPKSTRIRMILDNHSTHLSEETRSYLKSRPNRFEFVFTPTHGSWLNIIESFFAKLAKVFLKGLRVSSKSDLKQGLEQYLKELNETPVPFRWKYRLDTVEEGLQSL